MIKRIRNMVQYEKVGSHTELACETKYCAIQKTTYPPVVITLGLHLIQILLHMLKCKSLLVDCHGWLFILEAGSYRVILFARFHGARSRIILNTV